jgi:hypothetical protein
VPLFLILRNIAQKVQSNFIDNFAEILLFHLDKSKGFDYNRISQIDLTENEIYGGI